MRSLIVFSLIALASPLALAQTGNIFTTYNTTTTTSSNTTVTSSGNITSSGNLSGSTSSSSGSGMFTTHHGQGGNHTGSSDPTARQFPYDSTNGRNRSDLDTPRKGFDDPRNPWDGRYSNDNPDNYGPRDDSSDGNSYRPGSYGTHAIGPQHDHRD